MPPTTDPPNAKPSQLSGEMISDFPGIANPAPLATTVSDFPVTTERSVEPRFWEAPVRFSVEAIVGVFIFSVIAAAAVALSFGIKYLEANGVDALIIAGLKAAEYALFATDLILFLRYLWRTLRRNWEKF